MPTALLSRRVPFAAPSGTVTPTVPALPTAGRLLHLRPDTLQHNGAGRVTGWQNAVTGAVLAGGGDYTAADARFNGHASVELNNNTSGNYFEKFVIGTEPVNGLTIAIVVRKNPNATGPAEPQGDRMYWFMDTYNGPLDLWNAQATNLVLNTFGGTQYGYQQGNPAAALGTKIISVSIPHNDIRGAQFWQNGAQLPVNQDVNNIQNRPLWPYFYLGYCVPATNYNWDGPFAECIIYNRQLSAAEQAELHGNLKHKYAL